jgi:hypothetical protein
MTAAGDGPARSGWRRVVRPVLLGVFLLAVLAGLAGALHGQNWSVLATLTTPRSLALAAAAFAVNSVAMFLSMVAWRALLVDLGGSGEQVSGVLSARIYYVGFLAKFVPGRLLPLLANIRMGRAAGVRPGRMATVYVLTMVISSLTGLTVGLLAAGAFGGPGAALLLAALPVAAFAARPDLVNRAAGAAARLLRRPAPEARASDRGVRLAIAAQLLCWLAAGVQLWLLAIAQGAPAAAALPVCVGAFALGTVGGVVVVLAPDGIGVREAILLVALRTVLPLPAATGVVVASRLVCTLSEIAAAGVALAAAELVRRRQLRGRPSYSVPSSTPASPPAGAR